MGQKLSLLDNLVWSDNVIYYYTVVCMPQWPWRSCTLHAHQYHSLGCAFTHLMDGWNSLVVRLVCLMCAGGLALWVVNMIWVHIQAYYHSIAEDAGHWWLLIWVDISFYGIVILLTYLWYSDTPDLFMV